MKKLLKILLICAICLGVLLAAAVITLKIMFPPAKLKAMALAYAQENLHREITFDDVSFNLVGITLSDFALSEQSTFQQGTFVKTERLEVKIALKPLFDQRIEVKTIRIDGLDINIIKQKDGTFNFDSLIAAFNTDPQTPPTPTKPVLEEEEGAFVLLAERIALKDCHFIYKDLQTGLSAGLDHLNIDIRNLDLNEPFTVNLSVTTDYTANGLAMVIPLSLETEVFLANFDLSKASAKIKKLEASYQNMKVAMNGEVKNFKKPSASLNGKITGITNIALMDFVKDLPVFALPEIKIALKAAADIDHSSAQIEKASLSILDSAITSTASVSWKGPAVAYQAKADIKLFLNQISQLTPMLNAYGLGGMVQGAVKAAAKGNTLNLNGEVELKDLSVKYDWMRISALNGVINIASMDQVRCERLNGLFNDAEFTSSFSYAKVKDVMDIFLRLDLAKLTIAQFPSAKAQASQTQPAQPTAANAEAKETLMNIKADIKVGPVTVPYFETQGLTLSANLQKVSSSMQQTNGTVSFGILPGAIKDLDSFVKNTKFVDILLLPLSIINKVTAALGVEIFPQENPNDKGKIKFASADGLYVFTNGIMTVKKTDFISKLTQIHALGTADFKTRALNMTASATLLSSPAPIVIKIGGTIENPKGKLDVVNTVTSVLGGFLGYAVGGKAVTDSATLAGDAVKITGKVAGNAVKTGVTVGKDVAIAGKDVVKDTFKELGALFGRTSKTEKKQ